MNKNLVTISLKGLNIVLYVKEEKIISIIKFILK